MPAQQTRIRAIAGKGNGIGKQRNELYRNAFRRINESIKEGYYLEAIALTESLLSDRLESRVSHLSGRNVGFKTLEKLIRQSRETETDLAFKQLVESDVNSWRGKRNEALHEMVKIEEGLEVGWDERIENLKGTAKEGLKVLRKVDKEDKRLRKT